MAVAAGRAHVFVSDVGAPVVTADDRHHLERVLRLRPGDEITVADGAGRWRRCLVSGEPVGEVEVVERPAPAIAVGFALTKGERPEWAVQKLTEVGVDRIVPFVAARSVVRWDAARAAANVERWRRIAREAASQSRRVWLPEVADVQPFEAVVAAGALADPSGGPPSLAHPVVLVGPEGGWADEELAADMPRVRLGPHVLRAETAAMAAGVLLCGLRAKLVESDGE